MKPNGVELWAVILEKAFAKHCGSYAALSGGFSAWAWQALTGDHVFTLDKTKASRKAGATPRFERLNFKAVVDPAGKDKRKCKWYKSGEERPLTVANPAVSAPRLLPAPCSERNRLVALLRS